MTIENVVNRRFSEFDAQFEQLAGNLAIAPAYVLSSQSQTQADPIRFNARSSAPILVNMHPLVLHELAMPANDSPWRKQSERVTQLTGRLIGSPSQSGREHSQGRLLNALRLDSSVFFRRYRADYEESEFR